MTIDPRVERALPTILADLGSGGQPDYADALLKGIGRVPQRQAWRIREWWLPPDMLSGGRSEWASGWRPIALVALLLIAIIAAAIVASIGSRRPLPAPFGPAGNGLVTYGSAGDIIASDPQTGARLTVIAGPAYDLRAGYSPDGSKLGFLRASNATGQGPMDLMVATSDGMDIRKVNIEPLPEAPALWSWAPDSRSIVVILGDGPTQQYEIFDTTRTGSPRQVDLGGLVLDGPVFQPPDGRRVMFRGRADSKVGLYMMDADGSNLAPVIAPYDTGGMDPEGLDLGWAAWSPDGTRIAYQQHTSSTSIRLFIADADGSNAHVIGNTTRRDAGRTILDAFPNWSPDGTRVMFGRIGPDPSTYTLAVISLADDREVATGLQLDVSVKLGGLLVADGNAILQAFGEEGRNAMILDPAGGPGREIPWSPGLPFDWQRVAP